MDAAGPAGAEARSLRSGLPEPQYVLHIVQAAFLVLEEARGSKRPEGVGGAAARAHGDFSALALSDEHDGMLTDDIAAANGVKPDRPGIAFPHHSFAFVHGSATEVPAEGAGDHFAELERRARRRIDLVSMVCFEDLHVVSVTERERGRLDKSERDVHARRHIRRLYDRDLSRRRRDTPLLLRRKTGRSDNHAHTLLQALFQVRERTFRTGKIDEAVAFRDSIGEGGSDLHAAGASDQFSGILADDGASGNLQRRRELEIPRCESHLDQGAPHAASRGGDDISLDALQLPVLEKHRNAAILDLAAVGALAQENVIPALFVKDVTD